MFFHTCPPQCDFGLFPLFFGHYPTFSHGRPQVEIQIDVCLHCSFQKQGLATASRCASRSSGARLDEPATVIEVLLKLRFENQTKKMSFRWFQFRLTTYYGFPGPSTRSGSPCGHLIRSLSLQRGYAQPCSKAPRGLDAAWVLRPTPLYFLCCHLVVEAAQ